MAEDTLMAKGEEGVSAEVVASKHEILVENTAFDVAGYRVRKECPQCSLDYLSLTRIGEAENVILSCSCGYHASQASHEKSIKKSTGTSN
jgi:hypothetical protein